MSYGYSPAYVTLVDAVEVEHGCSEQEAKRLVVLGKVYLNGRSCVDPEKRVSSSDRIRVVS